MIDAIPIWFAVPVSIVLTVTVLVIEFRAKRSD